MRIPRRKLGGLRKRVERPESVRGNDGPIHMTEHGLALLRGKLAQLKRALPDLIAEAQRTAAYGDRSDNAEYKDAKSTLRRTHGRIFTIEDQMKRVVIIKSGAGASSKVVLGSTVVLETEGGPKRIFRILGPYETNPTMGRISYQSPLGAALMNHITGDTITIQTLSGSKKYRILEIK